MWNRYRSSEERDRSRQGGIANPSTSANNKLKPPGSWTNPPKLILPQQKCTNKRWIIWLFGPQHPMASSLLRCHSFPTPWGKLDIAGPVLSIDHVDNQRLLMVVLRSDLRCLDSRWHKWGKNGGAEIPTIASGIAVTCVGNQDLLLPPAESASERCMVFTNGAKLKTSAFKALELYHW